MPAPRARRGTRQNHTQDAGSFERNLEVCLTSVLSTHCPFTHHPPASSSSSTRAARSFTTTPRSPHDPRPHQGQRRRPRARRRVGALPPRALPRRARCAGRRLRARWAGEHGGGQAQAHITDIRAPATCPQPIPPRRARSPTALHLDDCLRPRLPPTARRPTTASPSGRQLEHRPSTSSRGWPDDSGNPACCDAHAHLNIAHHIRLSGDLP